MPQYGINASTPIWGDDDILFISSGYGAGSRGLKLARDGTRTSVTELWRQKKMQVEFSNVIRIGDFAYLPDVKRIPETSMPLLEGLDTLILDALSFNPKHPTHLSVGEAVGIGQQLGVERLYLTHIMHRLDQRCFPDQCAEQEVELPENTSLAFDGMEFEVGTE